MGRSTKRSDPVGRFAEPGVFGASGGGVAKEGCGDTVAGGGVAGAWGAEAILGTGTGAVLGTMGASG